jgi:uncharacterized membrane protein YhiD involved in acid resistance
MEDQLKQLLENIAFQQNQTILTVVVGFVLCIICSYVLKLVYQNFSRSISTRFQFAHLFPILSAATFLVIVIVKSSIALSLGLVGALSIVRFRTPIKEPEELVYLFIAIGLGIGFGADQIIPTLVIFILTIIIVYFNSLNQEKILAESHNLVIEVEVNKKDNFKNEDILNLTNSIFSSSKLIRIDINDKDEIKKINIFLEITLKDIKDIDLFSMKIKNNYKKSHVSFFENTSQF